MERRIFYELTIEAKRVEADQDYRDPRPLGEDAFPALKVVVDPSIKDNQEGCSVVLRSVLEALDAYYERKEEKKGASWSNE